MKNWTIVNHWTGGGYKATALDREHYNAILEGDGNMVYGDNTPEDQISTSDGIYGAHTRAFNTKCIGVAMACMAGAKESADPPDYGSKYPVTREQFMQMCYVNARYCIEYDIPVTRETVLMHSEVQPNLGIWQEGKWDINVLPFKPDLVGHRAVGDYMREVTQMAINEMQGGDEIAFKPAPAVRVRQSVLREGSNGPDVVVLQENLAALGFYLGRVDGDFGPNTASAVRELQRDYGLAVDGRAGPQTMGAITVAMHGRRDVSAPIATTPSEPERVSIRESTTIKAQHRQWIAAALGAAPSVYSAFQQQDPLVQVAMVGAIGLSGFGIIWTGRHIISERLDKWFRGIR